MTGHTALLRRAFDTAVESARPERWLSPQLVGLVPPRGRTRVLALGKAAVSMARVVTEKLRGSWEGLAVAVAGEGAPVPGFTVMEGAHPIPDGRSLAAGEAALAFAAATGPDDRLLVLVSGGASAVACAPIDGVTLEAKAALTRALLASGASIGEINTVRRAVSRLKGGGLARVARGPVLTLAVSDVPDDALHDIGSGPAVASPTGVDEALEVLGRHAPGFPGDLEAPMRAHAASLGPAPVAAARVVFRPADALAAVAALLQAEGWPTDNLGPVAGEARAVADVHAAVVGGARRAILSGGELSVSLGEGPRGRGGRNQEYLLAFAVALAGRADVWALAADTDGQDGSEPVAGAWIDPALLTGLDVVEARADLARHDAFGFFQRHGRVIEIGPTGVNVGDLRLILVDPQALA